MLTNSRVHFFFRADFDIEYSTINYILIYVMNCEIEQKLPEG